MNTLIKADVSVNVTVQHQVGIVLDAVRAHTRQALDGKVVALIAALPFLAGCRHALRDSIHNVLIYAAAQSKEIHLLTDHAPEHDEDVFARLRPMLQFSGGDSSTLEHGKALLGLVLVHGYHRDLAKDQELGQYNPILAGAWDFESKVEELDNQIDRNFSPGVERWMTKKEAVVMTWLA